MAKKEYVQPTHTFKVAGKIESEPAKVHKLFTAEWIEKVFRLKRLHPDWGTFQHEYGQYIPRVAYTQDSIDGGDLSRTVQAMGKTAPVLDGWGVHELTVLGREAWKQRARIVQVQLIVGEVTASHKQVSTPMMPKAQGTEVVMEHIGLAIYSMLWRVEFGSWNKRVAKWKEEWLPEGIHGARTGHGCMSSA